MCRYTDFHSLSDPDRQRRHQFLLGHTSSTCMFHLSIQTRLASQGILVCSDRLSTYRRTGFVPKPSLTATQTLPRLASSWASSFENRRMRPLASASTDALGRKRLSKPVSG